MSFKARLLLMLALGGIGAGVLYGVFGRQRDPDEPAVSHVASAADYGGAATMTPEACATYRVAPLAGRTDVHRRVTPDAHAPSLGTLPSGTIVGSREIRDGYVHLAQPMIGWVSLQELEAHCP